MSKKTALIIVIIFLIILGLAFWYFFVYSGNIVNTNTGGGNNLFPFGQGSGNEQSTGGGNGDEQSVVITNEENVPILRKLSSSPVAGFGIIESNKKTLVQYMDRGTGNVFQIPSDSEVSARLSNTTLPKVYEAMWSNGGKSIVLRMLKETSGTIQTLQAKLKSATTTGTQSSLSTVLFGEEMEDVSVLPETDKMFYVTQSASGATGVVSRTDGGGKLQIWKSPLIYWNSSWPRESTLTLTTRPSSNSAGVMYFVNTNTGSATKVLGPINGLTTLSSPDTNKILYSESFGQSINVYVKDLSKNEVKNFALKTLPEKCVWSKSVKNEVFCAVPKILFSSDYPDSWYKGLVSFDDSVWKINLETGETKKLADLANLSNQSIDAIKLGINSSGDFLVFINKIDLTLWGLSIPK